MLPRRPSVAPAADSQSNASESRRSHRSNPGRRKPPGQGDAVPLERNLSQLRKGDLVFFRASRAPQPARTHHTAGDLPGRQTVHPRLATSADQKPGWRVAVVQCQVHASFSQGAPPVAVGVRLYDQAATQFPHGPGTAGHGSPYRVADPPGPDPVLGKESPEPAKTRAGRASARDFRTRT